jgi:hypothetical protein
MIVALGRALVDAAVDRAFHEPAPFQHRIADQIDIGVAEQHRRAVAGLDTERGDSLFDGDGELRRLSGPKLSMMPAIGQWRQHHGPGEIHHHDFRPAARHQNVAPRRLAQQPSGDGGGSDQASENDKRRSEASHGRPW